MPHLNVEIKAHCQQPSFIRNYLLQHGAEYKGTDHQADTYFNTANGRLKLREGNIENNLIYYIRKNHAGPKQSHFQLLPVEDNKTLKNILTAANGIKTIVNKQREIYFIENVKFHIDIVDELGSFIEIEASDKYADKSANELLLQCKFYLKEFMVNEDDLISESYSDMLIAKKEII